MGRPDQPRDSRGRWKKGHAGAVALVAAVGVAAADGSSGASIGSSSGGVSIESSLGHALRAKLDKGKKSASRGRGDAAWKHLGLRRINQQIRRRAWCEVSSYGQVQEFFLRTPCRALDRMLFLLGDEHGNTIVVSVAWVEMGSANSARRLRNLTARLGRWPRDPERRSPIWYPFHSEQCMNAPKCALRIAQRQ